MKVLDLDMDYFMTQIAHTYFSYNKRLDENNYGNSVWSADKVHNFLECNLGLSKTHKIPGRIVRNHDESLYFWEELINKKKLNDPFHVVHVDSHADLGLGDPSSDFLQGAFLSLPIETRRKIRDYKFDDEIKGINMGNYLLWAVGYKMISSIVYCANPNGPKNDYIQDTLKDFQDDFIWNNPVKRYIQLKYNPSMEMPKNNASQQYIKEYLENAIKDPEVELTIIPTIKDVNFNGDFDFAVMAQSPNYTPASADFIIDIFKEFIIEI